VTRSSTRTKSWALLPSAALRARVARCCGAIALVAGTAAGVPAASLGEDRGRALDELGQADADLADRQRSAALELYALETLLHGARAEVAAVEQQAAVTGRELRSARARLAAARSTLTSAQRFLATRLREIYEQGRADPLAVLLGAESLQDALDGLDGLRLAAEQDRQIVTRTIAAKRALSRLARGLERKQSELLELREQARARAEALSRTIEQRRGYLARLSTQRGLNRQRISALEAQARAARERTQSVAAPAPVVRTATPAAPAAAPFEARRTLTVVALGYALKGTTATGLPVGWGVVAVDPSVIPLGTRLTIPGYGEGVAADTGSAVRGATIDLWFPSRAQALAWGTRTVTITIHS
jgi:peptidoglycan DL-endopeptidase CwlO